MVYVYACERAFAGEVRKTRRGCAWRVKVDGEKARLGATPAKNKTATGEQGDTATNSTLNSHHARFEYRTRYARLHTNTNPFGPLFQGMASDQHQRDFGCFINHV